MGCELASPLLIAYGSSINLQDKDGHTPMHLATIASNSHIIKNLLMKGAYRDVYD